MNIFIPWYQICWFKHVTGRGIPGVDLTRGGPWPDQPPGYVPDLTWRDYCQLAQMLIDHDAQLPVFSSHEAVPDLPPDFPLTFHSTGSQNAYIYDTFERVPLLVPIFDVLVRWRYPMGLIATFRAKAPFKPYIIKALFVRQGVESVFGCRPATVMELFNTLAQHPGLRCVATNRGKDHEAVVPELFPPRAQVYEYWEYGGLVGDRRCPILDETHHLLFIERNTGLDADGDTLDLVPCTPEGKPCG